MQRNTVWTVTAVGTVTTISDGKATHSFRYVVGPRQAPRPLQVDDIVKVFNAPGDNVLVELMMPNGEASGLMYLLYEPERG